MPDTATGETTASETGKAADAKPLADQQFTTRHAVTIGTERIEYTANVGRIVLHDDEEHSTPKVAIFYTAYVRDDVPSKRDRPLVFLWNGGPGSSTIWLHMYSYGPRRVVFDGDPLFDTSRWELRENEHSLLDVADLVFVDAPSTGFSRVALGEDPAQFHGAEADAAVIGDFVTEFVARENRGDSPIVLFGESYGTIRAPLVADYLQQVPGLFVDGVILLSSLMDVAGTTFGVGVNYGAVGQLPSYAATALYHGVISGDLPTVIAESEDFALNDYSVALLKGSRLTGVERERIARRLSELTGISAEFILRSNLRVNLWRYVKELLRDRHRTVGRLDTRWTGIDSDTAGETFEDDASYSAPTDPATRALNQYLRADLGWEADRPLLYRHIRPREQWKHRESEQMGIWTPQLEVATVLRAAMNRSPHLKVLLLSGYYDLGTPYFPAELTFDHLHLEPERARNVTKTRYESGHMIYLHEPSLAQTRADLVGFLSSLRGVDAA
ncbi:S10 family peptidase [Nonomuraea angiospora]